jgi:DNA polymerase III epsilon subunit family exonuclease
MNYNNNNNVDNNDKINDNNNNNDNNNDDNNNNNDKINNNTCQYIYKKGPKKGQICMNKTSKKYINLCSKHKPNLTCEKHINNLKFIITDIETTGLNNKEDDIIEIAYKIIQNNKIIKQYQSLIKTNNNINNFISDLTGIDNDILNKQGNDIKDVLNDFYRDCKDCVFVAHYSQFDYNFIYEKLKLYHNVELNVPQLCTCMMSRILKNNNIIIIDNCKLATLCQYYNIKNDNAHRAMSDVNATIELFNKIISLKNIYVYNYISKKIKTYINTKI